jgi:GMP synthase-like glutamine amidotransferase
VWVVIQHVSYDGRGGIGLALQRAGLAAVDCRPFAGERVPVVSELSGLIVLGAPGGSADADRPEHLLEERRLIERAVRLGKPVLGVCFGAQLLAVALGASVIKDGPLEVGIGSAMLTDAGRLDPVLGADSDVVPVLHWHRDAFTLPPGAVRLATDARGAEQAFRLGDKVYGLQFHLEINAELAATVGQQMPAGALPAEAVTAAASWGDGVLDRFLALT